MHTVLSSKDDNATSIPHTLNPISVNFNPNKIMLYIEIDIFLKKIEISNTLINSLNWNQNKFGKSIPYVFIFKENPTHFHLKA